VSGESTVTTFITHTFMSRNAAANLQPTTDQTAGDDDGENDPWSMLRARVLKDDVSYATHPP